MEVSEEHTTQRIVTIPIDVIKRQTSQTVKSASAQLKIRLPTEIDSLELVVACEEGLFLGVYDKPSLVKFKTKENLKDETWLLILKSLLDTNLFERRALPADYSNLVLHGKLYSLENYDIQNGRLIDNDLSEEVPEFELLIKTEGMLSVTFGVIPIQSTDPEICSDNDSDMLSWILIATSQIESLRRSLYKFKNEFEVYKEVAEVKEREVLELTTDYQMILRDLQDRFFQVLNEKKVRIQQLEGESVSNLELLNNDYVKRSKLNLNRVNIEDIIIDEESMQYKDKRKRKSVKPLKNTRSKRKLGVKTPHVESKIKSEYEVLPKNDDNLTDDDKNIPSSNDVNIKKEDTNSSCLQLSDTDYGSEDEDIADFDIEEGRCKKDLVQDLKNEEQDARNEFKTGNDLLNKSNPESFNTNESDRDNELQINSDGDVSTEYSE